MKGARTFGDHAIDLRLTASRRAMADEGRRPWYRRAIPQEARHVG